ncbi:MAG: type II toxin-antitoxin system PemK/MazF family toxin [Planctomycetaceae bacterium]
MPAYQFGDIVEVELDDPQGGNRKLRPAVILTPTDQISEETPVVVAAVSTQGPLRLLAAYFRLPHQNGFPHRVTGATKPCVVMCDWLGNVSLGEIRRKRGRVPDRILYDIATYLNDLQFRDETDS